MILDCKNFITLCSVNSCVPSCGPGRSCNFKQDIFVRMLVLGAQLFCIATTVVLAIIVFRKRKCKVILSSIQMNFQDDFIFYKVSWGKKLTVN